MAEQIPEQIANYYRTPSGKQKILDIIQQEENKPASPPAAHTPTPASAASAATPINTAWMSGDDAAAASRARIKSMMENALNTIVSLKDSETDTVNACKHLLEEAGKRDAALDGLRTEINEVLSTIAQQEAASKHSQTKVPETPNPAQLLGGWKPVKTIFK